MPEQPITTTAAALASFRKELIDGGFSEGEAFSLAHTALTSVLPGDGLIVREVAA